MCSVVCDVEERVLGVVCCLSGRPCPRCCVFDGEDSVLRVVCIDVEDHVIGVVCCLS